MLPRAEPGFARREPKPGQPWRAREGGGPWGNHGFPHAGTRCPSPRRRRFARRSGRERSRGSPSLSRYPTDRPEIAPLRAAVALGIVAHIPGADALRIRSGPLPRRLDVCPERPLVEVVVPREPREVLPGRLAQHAPRVAPARERPVEAPERLHAHQVAEREHVERDLEPKLPI